MRAALFKLKRSVLLPAALSGLLTAPFAGAADVEFLHWWTSEGEKKALEVLVEQLENSNLDLTPVPVLGGGGDSAMTVLQARALAGNTPSFAQIEGPSIKAWDAIGILYPLNEVAQENNWNEVLYPLSQEINTTQNGYVALPLTLHRLNWLWINNKLLKQLDLEPPQTWQDMFNAIEKARDANLIPLAIGEEPWQIAQLFESLVIATGGVEFYKRTLVELDPRYIDSDTMRFALSQLRRLFSLRVDGLEDDKWDTAAKALAEDRALFQIGGDWVLGDLLARGIKVPEHVGCQNAPQSHNTFLYNMDSLIFMVSKEFSEREANQLAQVLAAKDFQERFNQVKGSIPVRMDIDLSNFNPCQVKSYEDFVYAQKHNLGVPSLTNSMAVNPVAKKAINSEIFRFYRNNSISEDQMIKRFISIATSN
ncbi:ABC transporter substrate-binding protein [Vibrio sonorensis]|uniref:ABC transporter substrate-binding protein n=1 Tax=Vibrio sonorensis TaxID=1004316 RepID=UPI0008DA2E2A|nr:ABC transporter substrate-binding protein [Vibrio sonorensis]